MKHRGKKKHRRPSSSFFSPKSESSELKSFYPDSYRGSLCSLLNRLGLYLQLFAPTTLSSGGRLASLSCCASFALRNSGRLPLLCGPWAALVAPKRGFASSGDAVSLSLDMGVCRLGDIPLCEYLLAGVLCPIYGYVFMLYLFS